MTNLLASYGSIADAVLIGAIIGGVVGLIISIVIAVITAKLANRKGYSFWGFFWLSIFIGILALIIAACLVDRNATGNVVYPSRYGVQNNSRQSNQTHRTGGTVMVDYTRGIKYWRCNACGAKNGIEFTTCSMCGNKLKSN